MGASELAIVVLTHNRRDELLRTLARLTAAHAGAPIRVVDNGSSDATLTTVARHFPRVERVRLARNLGAAGRNHGVHGSRAAYVAFCDDDCWWAPGSLARAAALLDAHPRVAALTARVLVGPEEREDPTCGYMAECGRRRPGTVPGFEVVGFLAGACVMRREAFLAVGGYEPRLFIGGEERLLALDLLAAGWLMAYVPELVVHHLPSPRRDSGERRHLLLRNALWCAWLRRPLAGAWGETRRRLRGARAEPRLLARSVMAALGGLPWVLRNRRVVPAEVEARLQVLDPRQGEA